MSEIKKKNLFVEIRDSDYLISVGEYDDELNFKILESEIIRTDGLDKGKIINLDKGVENLKDGINKIESKFNCFFEKANVIINHQDYDCINVSGFKKLNGNQILSDDISFILNDIRNKLSETEKNKTIVHLFNTEYLLDNKQIKNLPIGLHGDFYSHQLSFFLIKDTEFKNLSTLFNKCNLRLNKIVIKSFAEGIKLIKEENNDTFFKINIHKKKAQLIFFYNSAFCYSQSFSFGSNLIIKDISKVCSLKIDNVNHIFKNLEFNNKLNLNNYLDKKYFQGINFRKISLKHLLDISEARIEEIIDIIYNNNINLNFIKNNKNKIYLEFEDKDILRLFQENFKNKLKNSEVKVKNFNQDLNSSIEVSGDLLSKGWIREAIPVINKKSSWISRIFSGFFE